MNLKSVAAIAVAAAAIVSTAPASATPGAAGPVHIDASQSSVADPDRSYGRHHRRARYIVFRTPRYRAVPQFRRMRHAVVRLQLRVLALQVRRLRYVARYHVPRARVHVRGGGYRMLAPRTHVRLVRLNPRVGFRRFRI